MKKFIFCLVFLLPVILLMTGCVNTQITPTPTEEQKETSTGTLISTPTPSKTDVSTTPTDSTVAPDTTNTVSELRDLRVIVSSDIHCTDLQEWYNVGFRKRMQHWVDSIKAEHAEKPIDLLVINGDISLDYWINGGSVINKGKGTSGIFINEYLSQLPDEIPVYILPGNHEQYSDEDWLSITGNHRQGYLDLGGRLFVFLDNFSGNLDPKHHHDGVYTTTDVEYIEELMGKYPEHDVYLFAHYFDTSKESAKFKKLVAENDRVKGLFAGHTHLSTVVNLDASWGNKTIAQTGNFAYYKDSEKQSFWGFRDLIITSQNAYSQYIIEESKATINGVYTTINRKILNQVCYYGVAPELPKDDDPLSKYTKLYDKIDQSSVTGDEGMKESNRVQLIFDQSVNTKWCVRPTSADGSVTVYWNMTESVRVDAYAISTANDHLSRNPDAWTIYATNDPDGEWVVLSQIKNGNLPKELFTVSDVFEVENPGEYKYYKMVVTENFNNRDLYQFSELILLQK